MAADCFDWGVAGYCFGLTGFLLSMPYYRSFDSGVELLLSLALNSVAVRLEFMILAIALG